MSESNWTTRLPYAHRYITKTLFEGAEADLDPPEEITSMDPIHEMRPTHMHRPVYSTYSTTVHLERIKRYYYEVSVPLGVQGSEPYKWMTIGYTGPHATILYANNGDVFMNTLEKRVHAVIPYGAGDIVGCGYEFPSRFFFTINGIYLGHCIAHPGFKALRPEARTWVIGRDFREPMNLGQRRFMFDIEGHFDKRCARLRRLTESLPLELLEDILQFALLPQDINRILHLSRVCRRWHTLTFRSVIDLSIVTRKDLEDLLKILRARTPIHARSVNTEESSDETWLHCLLASPLSHIKSTSKLAIMTSTQHQLFLEKVPPSLSSRVSGILGRTSFTEVHTLELSRYSFPTWTRFAQIVFAFQRLETLVCSSVTWDTSPPTPPTWLKFSRRLRHASFENMVDQCVPGSLWLFLAGRPRQTSDDLVLVPSDVSIIGQLASLILRPTFTIGYDRKQGQPRSCQCTLSFTKQIESSTVSDLSFEFEGHDATYQLTRMFAHLTEDGPSRYDNSNLRVGDIGGLATTLSSANSCRFSFNFTFEWQDERTFTSHRTKATMYRRQVAKAMMRQHSAGLLECTCNGEAIEDTDGVQWLKLAGAALTFGVKKTYKRGASGHVTWDVDALRLTHRFIPWLKLYKHNDQITSGQFIADVAFDINAESGQAEFPLPDSAAPGRYFLVVGDYVYRTKCFQIIP